MKALQELAARLLTDKTVTTVIGWANGPRGPRPTFVTSPDQADKLVFDTKCVHNLATYLNPRRSHLVPLGKKAVVVKGCDARAVAGLIRETQVKRENVMLIGVRCGGVVRDLKGDGKLTEATISPRCKDCDIREPKLADHLVGELPPAPPSPKGPSPLEKIEAMSPEERWAFWQKELSRCVRCHACREICPMCFCDRCVADKAMPQWIESSPHPRGNLAWQMTRVMHMAGRCVGCGECTRACPEDIPIGLILMKMHQVIEERFGYRAVDDPSVPCPIGAYRLDDKQEFIL
jgi:formate dehydrogenase subunit beta